MSARVDPELERTIRDAYAAFAEGDVESLRDFWHEDAIYVMPMAHVVSTARAAWHGSRGTGPAKRRPRRPACSREGQR